MGHARIRERLEPKNWDYASTVEALLDAGANIPEKVEGTDTVKAIFQRRGMR